MKIKNIKGIGIGVFIIILLTTFFLLNGGSESIISSSDGGTQKIETPFSCVTSDTCETSLLDAGAITPESLEEAKETYDIICENKMCVGIPK